MLDIKQRLGDFPQMQVEILKRLANQINFDLRCAAPGIILSFDSSKQTCVVQLAVKEILRRNTVDGTVMESVDIPPIVDVPLVFPKAGGYQITFPVNEGDECLVIFADTYIDSWWERGCNKNSQGVYEGQEPNSLRRHDLSDGFAILAPSSVPKATASYSTTALELRSDDGLVKIKIDKDNEISIEFGGSTKINVKDGEVIIDSDSIKLGGISGLNKLIDSRIISLYNAHTHSGVQTGGGVTGTPVIALTEETVATENTEAK